MNKLSLGLVLAVGAVPSVALTAPLDLPVLGAPLIEDSVLVDYDLSDIVIAGSFGGTSSAPVPATGLLVDLSADIEPSGMIGSAGGALVVDGLSDPIEGTLSAFGFVFDDTGLDTLEFLFDLDRGPVEFGSRVLATVTGEFGDEAFFFSQGYFTDDAQLTIAPVGVVPLPATALLLFCATASLAGARRRRA